MSTFKAARDDPADAVKAVLTEKQVDQVACRVNVRCVQVCVCVCFLHLDLLL